MSSLSSGRLGRQRKTMYPNLIADDRSVQPALCSIKSQPSSTANSPIPTMNSDISELSDLLTPSASLHAEQRGIGHLIIVGTSGVRRLPLHVVLSYRISPPLPQAWVWDVLLSLPDECRMLRKGVKLSVAIYILSRYASLISFLPQ